MTGLTQEEREQQAESETQTLAASSPGGWTTQEEKRMTNPYEDVPTAVVYDEFSEAATTLTGLYNSRSNSAATAEERQEWWDRVIALRDTRRAVPAHDRDQLIAHIERWTREIQELESADRG